MQSTLFSLGSILLINSSGFLIKTPSCFYHSSYSNMFILRTHSNLPFKQNKRFNHSTLNLSLNRKRKYPSRGWYHCIDNYYCTNKNSSVALLGLHQWLTNKIKKNTYLDTEMTSLWQAYEFKAVINLTVKYAWKGEGGKVLETCLRQEGKHP